MSEEEKTVAAAAVILFNGYYLLKNKKEKKKRRWWTSSYNKSRTRYNDSDMLNDFLKEPSRKSENFCRMSVEDFEHLLNRIGPHIAKSDTNMRMSIPIQERFVIALRFLASGDSYSSPAYLFKVSIQTFSRCVDTVCRALMQELSQEIKHYSGLEEAVIRNITACKDFAHSVRSAYGPNGMNKMVINHIEKQFVTSDAATIIRELDVEHPAAKLMIMGSQMQDAEVGDGTNFVIILAGALLEASEELIRLGVTPTEIAEGFEIALEKSLEILPSLVCYEVKDYRNIREVAKCLKTPIQSKQYGNEDFLAELVTKACVSIIPEQTTFNVDNVRVCKVLGSGLHSSQIVQGMVFKRQVEGEITKVEKAKIALYSCAVDIMQTETKGTVLIKTADELMNFSRGEENLLETQIKAIADTGAKVIVAGAKYGDMALHYINKYGIMAVRLNSKFDLRRLSKTVGGTVLPRLIPPTSQELGYADVVCVDELGDTPIVAFRLENKESRIATVVVRGATDNYMDDIQRAIDDGVNTFKCLSRNGKLVPGAGATEAELAIQLTKYADTLPGLEQYSVRKFATALESFPKALADNSGHKSTAVLEKILEAHKNGEKNIGVDIDSENTICNALEKNILDLYVAKYWGLKYAVGAAATVLRVDQIIMAKRAGGPKARKAAGSDDES